MSIDQLSSALDAIAAHAAACERVRPAELLRLAELGDQLSSALSGQPCFESAVRLLAGHIRAENPSAVIAAGPEAEDLLGTVLEDVTFSASGRTIVIDTMVATGSRALSCIAQHELRPENTLVLALAASSPTNRLAKYELLVAPSELPGGKSGGAGIDERL